MPAVPVAIVASAWTRADLLGVVGLVVTIVGFVLAIWQLQRTVRAAEATRDALTKSNRTQMLFLLPQFRHIETELDYAIKIEQGRELAPRILASYAHLANEVAGMIEVYGLADPDTAALLRTSSRSASDAKDQLFVTRRKVVDVTRSFRQELAAVSVRISQVMTTQQQQVLDMHKKGASWMS